MNINELYNRLFSCFGPMGWWPGESSFEHFIGTILAQNTRWERVVPVIERMKNKGFLTPEQYTSISQESLAELLKGSGTYQRKAQYLQTAGKYMISIGWNGTPESVTMKTHKLRSELLSLKGIGPETCDCILLYVLERPVFVVDAYTKRILERHGLCGSKAIYQEVQNIFHTDLTNDVKVFKEFHALIVECAKKFCRPKPLCTNCPLKEKGVSCDC